MKRRKSSSVRISSTVECIGCLILEATQCRPWSHIISRVGKSATRGIGHCRASLRATAESPFDRYASIEPQNPTNANSRRSAEVFPVPREASRIPSARQVVSGT